jgi:hypothetical protein
LNSQCGENAQPTTTITTAATETLTERPAPLEDFKAIGCSPLARCSARSTPVVKRIYCEDELGRRSAAKLMTRSEKDRDPCLPSPATVTGSKSNGFDLNQTFSAHHARPPVPAALVIDFGQITTVRNKVLVPTSNMDEAHEFKGTHPIIRRRHLLSRRHISKTKLILVTAQGSKLRSLSPATKGACDVKP